MGSQLNARWPGRTCLVTKPTAGKWSFELALSIGFLVVSCWSAQNDAPGSANATILETKVICREPGKYLGQGSEYGVNKDGHLVIKKRELESERYIGWPTIAKTREGELMVAFSGDRDSHVDPWGKTQLIRSADDGKSWSTPQTITSTPLDDRDAGLIQTKTGALLVSWFTSIGFDTRTHQAAAERYARHGEKIPTEAREKWLGNWV